MHRLSRLRASKLRLPAASMRKFSENAPAAIGRMGDPPTTNDLISILRPVLPEGFVPPGGNAATAPTPIAEPSPRGRVSTMVGGRELSLEVGRVGPLADAVVYARYGATTVLASAVSSWSPAVGGGFLPLQVDYIEKAFAAGQIPTTFTRRESSSSDRELLAARAIDRSLRPLFDDGYFYDTQIICSVMSFDKDCDPGMLAILASSAALHVRVQPAPPARAAHPNPPPMPAPRSCALCRSATSPSTALSLACGWGCSLGARQAALLGRLATAPCSPPARTRTASPPWTSSTLRRRGGRS